MADFDNGNHSADPDTRVILEVFDGARRSDQDPDVELVAILPRLEGNKNLLELIRTLRNLVRDANND